MNLFVVSDTHFSHANILKFLRPDGTPMRVFESVEAMDEHMVKCWNRVVRPSDHVYHLGDVAMVRPRRVAHLLTRLNGHLRLVRGNHDIYRTTEYLEFFDEVHGSRKLDKWILSHYPIHPDSIPKWCAGNVHGHVHANAAPAGQYINVSVEAIDYTPVALEALRVSCAEGVAPEQSSAQS